MVDVHNRRYVQTRFYFRALLSHISRDIDGYGRCVEEVSLSTRIQIPHLPPLMLPAALDDFIYINLMNCDGGLIIVGLAKNQMVRSRIKQLVSDIVTAGLLHTAYDPAPADIVLVRSSAGNFVRGAVLCKPSFMKVKVYAVDEGTLHMVSMEDVFSLEDEELRVIPPQAFVIQPDMGAYGCDIDYRRLEQLMANRLIGFKITGVTRNGEGFLGRIFFEGSDGGTHEWSDLLYSKRSKHQLAISGNAGKRLDPATGSSTDGYSRQSGNLRGSVQYNTASRAIINRSRPPVWFHKEELSKASKSGGFAASSPYKKKGRRLFQHVSRMPLETSNISQASMMVTQVGRNKQKDIASEFCDYDDKKEWKEEWDFNSQQATGHSGFGVVKNEQLVRDDRGSKEKVVQGVTLEDSNSVYVSSACPHYKASDSGVVDDDDEMWHDEFAIAVHLDDYTEKEEESGNAKFGVGSMDHENKTCRPEQCGDTANSAPSLSHECKDAKSERDMGSADNGEIWEESESFVPVLNMSERVECKVTPVLDVNSHVVGGRVMRCDAESDKGQNRSE
ncbi:hypothetical protein Tcan_03782 [Toxocara canis]|uniref:Tudor domain-containing protein n=1 Tax=Toxocara canis TaxID=6265 RepID=A0A0B2VT25_TOXCA|nr:hypothetical protein Tcan_03782 [Toxocara canis]